MKIYFGQTSPDEFGTDGLLEHDGDYYSGAVEFGTNPGGIEDVMIMDGCGRRVPISIEHANILAVALKECANIKAEIDYIENLEDKVYSDEVGTICEFGHVHY